MRPNKYTQPSSRFYSHLARAAVVGSVLLALAACGSAESGQGGIGQLVFEDPVDPDGPAPAGEPSASEWLGLGADGSLVWFAGDSGEVLASAAQRNGSSAPAIDLAYDPARGRALLVHGSHAAAEPVPVVAYPMRLGRPAFDTARHVGEARWPGRLWPVSSGVVVFERGPTPQWQLLSVDGVAQRPWQAPPPSGLWGRLGSARFEASVHQLQRAAAVTSWLDVTVHATGFGPVVERPLPAPPSAALASVRLAPHREGVLAAWATATDVVLSVHGPDGQLLRTHHLGAASSRVVAVQALDSSRSRQQRYALLLAEPPRLCVVQLGEPLQSAGVVLSGPVAADLDAFSRSLVARRARLWVATGHGVSAFDVSAGPTGIALSRDHTFVGEHLRGPLAGPVVVE